MTYEQYWYGDPRLVIAYRAAHKLKIEQENQKLWLQGLYIYNAVGVNLANLFKDKSSSPKTYLDKPIDLFNREPSEEDIIAQRNKVIHSLSVFQNMWKGKGK